MRGGVYTGGGVSFLRELGRKGMLTMSERDIGPDPVLSSIFSLVIHGNLSLSY